MAIPGIPEPAAAVATPTTVLIPMEAAKWPATMAGQLGAIQSQGRYSVFYNSWALQCCGLGTLQNLTGGYYGKTWAEDAEFAAAVYRALYGPGNAIYVTNVTNTAAHRVMLLLGAKQIHEFNNQYHSSTLLGIWIVNVLNAVGRYCDKYGEPYKEPPAELPGNFIADVPTTRSYPSLPTKA